MRSGKRKGRARAENMCYLYLSDLCWGGGMGMSVRMVIKRTREGVEGHLHLDF